jgi:hydrogenase expression/formation protein HypC
MCLAIPSKIIEIDNFRAMVDVYGARREVNLMLMPEEVGIGDFVLVHAGFAIQKVEHELAHEALTVISGIIGEMEKESGALEESPTDS